MNIFTANQVNQVYVMVPDGTYPSTVVATLDASHQITKSNNLGSVGVGLTPDGQNIYFKHLGVGGVTRSDNIDVNNIMYIKATPASKMNRSLMTAKVTLNSQALSSAKPIAGEDFVLRLKFQNPMGMSSDNQYWKYGVVHTTSNTTESDFYKTLALSIAKNMSREEAQLIKVVVNITVTGANGGPVEVTPNMTIADIKKGTGSTADSVLIQEVEQDWIRGIKQQKPVIFTVEPTVIKDGNTEIYWADVVYSNKKKYTGGVEPAYSVVSSDQPAAAGTVVNSKLMADYEYFYMGERGDQYRMVGWPDYVPTKYLVKEDYTYGYDTIAIHYAYTGANHAVQKSEKDITFIVPRVSTDNADATKIAAIGALAQSLLAAIQAKINPADTRYIQAGAATTSGKLAVFDSNGALTASTKEPGDIS